MNSELEKDNQEDISVELSPVGAETEEELKTDYLKKLTDVVTWSTDWTIESLINQLDRKNIDLNPRFQRRDAWSQVKKSRLIESIIYGLPIPQIVLAEDKKKRGKFIVVDGKQRLITLQRFCREENDSQGYLVLKGLRNEKLNGLSYEGLKKKFRDLYDHFLNQSIRSVIIKNWPSEHLLYTIFFRLNTGSLSLSPQELRRALKPGPFMDYVDDFSQTSNEIKGILKLSEPDYRMRDIDLVIRYYAFRNFVNKYRGDYKSFLDETCEEFNKDWQEKEMLVKEQSEQLNSAIRLSSEIFGKDHVFRRWNGKRYEPRMNRAIFDVMVYYFCIAKDRKIFNKNKKTIKDMFNDYCMNNDRFIKSISSNTNNLIETSTRFVLWGKVLQKFDRKLSIPSHLTNHFKSISTQ